MSNETLHDLNDPRFWKDFVHEVCFEVTSGRIAVGDPFACLEAEGMHYLDGVRNGRWLVQAETVERDSETHVWMLRVVHEEFDEKEGCPYHWLGKLEISSGLCGILDADFFNTAPRGTVDDPNSFVAQALRNVAKSKARNGDLDAIMGRGVISQAGYGTGEYNGYFDLDEEGRVIEVEVLFFFDDEDRDGNPI